MKLSKLLLIILIIALFSFSMTFLAYTFYIVEEIYEMDMKIKVGGIVGLDVNSSALSFGTVPIGGLGERPVTLRNEHDKPMKVHIKKKGEMAGWVYSSEDSFILEPNTAKEIKITAIPPYYAEERNYQGKLVFVFTRVI